ncbi:MAG: UDP-3-O-acyl-N-acetylglucosamine deacetylase [Turneriella sp.]
MKFRFRIILTILTFLKNQAVQLKYEDKTFVKGRSVLRARLVCQMLNTTFARSCAGWQHQCRDLYPDSTTMNDFRFERESVFHKILDLIGDLALVGRPIQGHILGARGGHALDVAFGKKLLQAFG